MKPIATAKSQPLAAPARSDLWFALAYGCALAIYTAAEWLGWSATGPARAVAGPLLAAGFLLLPGFALAQLARFDRYGLAALASLSVALSLALLALATTGSWLLLGRLLPAPTATLVAVFSVAATAGAIGRARPGRARQAASGWQVLGLLTAVTILSAVALTAHLPVSAATRFTEFSAAPVHGVPTSVTVSNHEGHAETYLVRATRGETQLQSAPIVLRDGESERVPLSLPGGAEPLVQLDLYRAGDSTPYRHLTVHVAP